MRAAAIFGLGSSTKDLKPFRKNSTATWLIGLPTNSTEADVILIFGGDGTVHRHLEQLVKLQLPVLIIPCGSGNDFARALNLRTVRDSVKAWHSFLSGGSNVRRIDLGLITPLMINPQKADALLSPSRYSVPGIRYYFCCVGGVGLDSEIARRANELPRWLRGHGGYVFSLLPALFQFAAFPMTISVPGAENPDVFVTHSTKPTILAAFANAPSYGGGMKIAPQARLDDGQLDICVISDINKLKLFCLFPTVYFGKHLSVPQVEYFQAHRLRLETEKPLDVYADGEYVCQTPIAVNVARAALRVVVA
jgi:diacylglycerol kinase (ATP)